MTIDSTRTIRERSRRLLDRRPSIQIAGRREAADQSETAMFRNSLKTAILVALSLFVIAGCAQDKQLAQTAIQNAEKALNDMSADAMAYMPEEFQAAQDALAAAKASFEAGNFKEAAAAAQEIATRAPEMATELTTRKQELTAAWADMNAAMPATMSGIQSQVDKIVATKKLPKGIDAAKMEEISAQVASLNQAWTEASSAAAAGSMAEAVAKGKMVQDGAAMVMTTLGM